MGLEKDKENKEFKIINNKPPNNLPIAQPWVCDIEDLETKKRAVLYIN